jgi:hypothetical protein
MSTVKQTINTTTFPKNNVLLIQAANDSDVKNFVPVSNSQEEYVVNSYCI